MGCADRQRLSRIAVRQDFIAHRSKELKVASHLTYFYYNFVGKRKEYLQRTRSSRYKSFAFFSILNEFSFLLKF